MVCYPKFVTPRFSLPAALLIAPVAVVSITEHIGHLLVTNNIVGRDLGRDPGLHRSILGDGLATSLAALLVVHLILPMVKYRCNGYHQSVQCLGIGWAAAIAIVFAFVQKLGVAIQTIPQSVARWHFNFAFRYHCFCRSADVSGKPSGFFQES